MPLGGGCDGVIASGDANCDLPSCFPRPTLIVSPGIRPAGAATDDHKRFTDASDAMRLGADYLVVAGPSSRRRILALRLHASSRKSTRPSRRRRTWTFESNRRRRPTYRLILRLIKGLAEYEKLTQDVVATEEGCTPPVRSSPICGSRDWPTSVRSRSAFALFFHNFSTFRGAPGSTWRTSSWSRMARARIRAPPDRASRRHCGGTWLPSPRMGGPRLERSRDRLLPRAGRDADGRLVHLSSRWSRASRSRRGCLKAIHGFLCRARPDGAIHYWRGNESCDGSRCVAVQTRALLVLVVAASISVLAFGTAAAAGGRAPDAARRSGILATHRGSLGAGRQLSLRQPPLERSALSVRDSRTGSTSPRLDASICRSDEREARAAIHVTSLPAPRESASNLGDVGAVRESRTESALRSRGGCRSESCRPAPRDPL